MEIIGTIGFYALMAAIVGARMYFGMLAAKRLDDLPPAQRRRISVAMC